ncbi:MAG: ParB N-terminal domain-containing protein [Bacteroidota bacterium]
MSEEKILIDAELQGFITPMEADEKKQLEANILSEGCRDPLVVWQKEVDQFILIDGHNRFDICTRHDLPFQIKKLKFDALDKVKEWMIDNQLGRRNLNPDQLSYYRGLKYERLKQKKGGYDKVESKGQKDLLTSEKLAKEFNVSEKTIKRDAKYAVGLDIIAQSNPKLKDNILLGKAKVNKSDIQTLAEAEESEKINIKNEADLYNKAKNIARRKEEEKVAHQEEEKAERIAKAQEVLRNKEPVFNNKDERISRIKGNIISNINKAINQKDIDAIDEVKRLLSSLEKELLT